jgi:hypothetical protein
VDVGVAVGACPTTIAVGVLVGRAVRVGVEGGADVTVACGVRVGVVVAPEWPVAVGGTGVVVADGMGVLVAVGAGALSVRSPCMPTTVQLAKA